MKGKLLLVNSISPPFCYSNFAVTDDGEVKVANDDLDAEKIPTYYVTFTATDSGGRVTSVVGTITLLDINDNPPE